MVLTEEYSSNSRGKKKWKRVERDLDTDRVSICAQNQLTRLSHVHACMLQENI